MYLIGPRFTRDYQGVFVFAETPSRIGVRVHNVPWASCARAHKARSLSSKGSRQVASTCKWHARLYGYLSTVGMPRYLFSSQAHADASDRSDCLLRLRGFRNSGCFFAQNVLERHVNVPFLGEIDTSVRHHQSIHFCPKQA